MTNEQLFRAIGQVGDDLIAEAARPRKLHTWPKWVALAACCALAIGLANITGLLDFGAKSAAPTESAPMYSVTTDSAAQESFEEEAIAEAPEAEAPTAEEAPAESPDLEIDLAARIVFAGKAYLYAADDGSVELGELLGTVEDGHVDYLGCEVYAADAEDCVFVLHDGEYELFRVEQ